MWDQWRQYKLFLVILRVSWWDLYECIVYKKNWTNVDIDNEIFRTTKSSVSNSEDSVNTDCSLVDSFTPDIR